MHGSIAMAWYRLAIILVLASAAPAASSHSFHKHATHHRRRISSTGKIVESFHPKSKYQTLGDGVDLNITFSARDEESPVPQAATSFLHSFFELEKGSYETSHSAVTDTGTYVYFKQIINGVPAVNSVAHVAITPANKVIAVGANYVEPASILSTNAKISETDAFVAAEKHFGGTRVNVPVTTQYFITDTDLAVLVYVVQVQTRDGEHWYQAYVDTTTGKILGAIDFVAHFSYKVIPIEKQDLRDGGFQVINDPQNPNASPMGWHDASSPRSTSGNNVVVYNADIVSNVQAESGNGQFFFDFDPQAEPSSPSNLAVAKTNAFYLVNKYHDFAYLYGFTEKMFNFQDDNGGKGGVGGDRVQVSIQGNNLITNKANFATPPDGQHGQMRLYLWTAFKPFRDCALENDIVIHEMTHGLTNRMIGGGTGLCLASLEAGGMGEGWSDAIAYWSEQAETTKDFTVGSWVAGQGVREYPYSTSKTTNPLMYHHVAVFAEPHQIGLIWGNILFNINAALVSKWGFSRNAQKDASGSEGNVVWLHLFIDSLPLMPCNPTMTDARDAWIQADKNRYGSIHMCTLWEVFASRGLGWLSGNYMDDSTLPVACGGTGTGVPSPPTAPKPTTTTIQTGPTQPPTTTRTGPKPTEPILPNGCIWWWPYCNDT